MLDPNRRIIDSIASGEINTPDKLQRAKVRACKEYGLGELPTNSEILASCPDDLRERVLPLLRKKPTRTLSGVAVVALMTEPAPCPHGRCIYCPGGVGIGTPQSYTGREPAALRAIEHDFDPYSQTRTRLDQLKITGHSVDKVDVIVMGGTFTSFDLQYREWFIKRCFDAMNRVESGSLTEAQELNESAPSRCVGLTIETRPDCFGKEDANHSMLLGATRVELGVQTTRDYVLSQINRGHGTRETIKATKLAKDLGFKVGYHMMPGLPGTDFNTDMGSFREIFSNENYRPDMLKIYPTLVVEGTQLYEMWKDGDYEPYRDEEIMELLAEIKRFVPRWVRIQRVQRDIPAPLIVDGVKKGDIRLHAQRVLKERGGKCNCIRCREIGRIDTEELQDDLRIVMKREQYNASGGTEVFLSHEVEEYDGVAAYARLRVSNEIARIRELKVLGEVVPIDEKAGSRWQHKGLGRELVNECERIATEEWGLGNISVTSGVGARQYYRRIGYSLKVPYMEKNIEKGG